jgi:hypothetical protein
MDFWTLTDVQASAGKDREWSARYKESHQSVVSQKPHRRSVLHVWLLETLLHDGNETSIYLKPNGYIIYRQG